MVPKFPGRSPLPPGARAVEYRGVDSWAPVFFGTQKLMLNS